MFQPFKAERRVNDHSTGFFELTYCKNHRWSKTCHPVSTTQRLKSRNTLLPTTWICVVFEDPMMKTFAKSQQQ